MKDTLQHRVEEFMPVLTVNGHKHNYEEVGEGTPILYIAATRFDSAKQWAPHMREHAKGFRVIMPDPRGLAGSEHMASVEPADWVNDLGGFLDQMGLRSVHLAAETLGTRIVTRFAADHPDRVSTLILNGSIAYSAASGDAARTSALSDQRKRDLELHHGADWEAVNTFYLNLHARPEFHEFYDLRAAAERVKAPVLLIRGDAKNDPVHPVEHSVELHNRFERSWLAIFPNTEFNAIRGRPEQAWQLIREFIDENGS
jgi:pimeloyl-ACP methyl ester carboxylesterase